MKKIVFILLCMIIPVIALSQETKHVIVDEVSVTPPKFMHSEQIVQIVQEETTSLLDYLTQKFVYPEEWKLLYQGIEVIQFTVTEKGELENFVAVNSIAPVVDDYIIELIKTTEGLWKPGTNNGEPIAMEKEVAMQIKTGEVEGSPYIKSFKALATNYYKQGSKQLLIKGHSKRALKRFDNAVQFAPYEKSALMMRGLCRYEIGDTDGARQDWIRLKELGGIDMEAPYFSQVKHLKGYEELAFILSE
ncbi:hypothetical protein [Plebeiibacterium sediminum]|uniref:TonB C-terminal domain-containing protein n=1 Tax=Plebeiibacterium sediminum TaxID=2992112 RepID=A0AAE3M654_9BACT|nr:hypothetical protein [Plebeiobacterium sediminum]MCW3787550.1 hypothetical protein [Plebeiobacterium sediminum]